MPSVSLAVLRYFGENDIKEAGSDTLAKGADLNTRSLYKAIRNLVTRGYLEMDADRVYHLTDKGSSAVRELRFYDTEQVADSSEWALRELEEATSALPIRKQSIFISYSRTDADVAGFIARVLEEQGMDVFIDYEQLIGGEDFTRRLAMEISTRDALVFLLSRDSINSRWVRAEVDWAFNHDKHIIPVMLELVDLSRFFYLISVQQIDFTNWMPAEDMSIPVAKLLRALAG